MVDGEAQTLTTAIDTETCRFFPGVLAPPLVCVSHCGPEGKGVVHWTDPDLPGLLRSWFAGETTWANAPYDLAVLINAFPDFLELIFEAVDAGRVHDIQTREKLGDLARGTFRFEEDEDGNIQYKGYSLAQIGERRGLGGKKFDNWRLRYHELRDVPISMWPKEAIYYSMRDAVLTGQIHDAQEGDPNLGDEAAQVRAHLALHLISCRGIRTNPERVAALERATVDRLAELLPGLVQNGLAREDGTRDTKEAVKRMVGILGEASVLTAKGEELRAEGRDPFLVARADGKLVSVAEEPCMMSGDHVLVNYSEYAKLRNLFSGAIKDLKKGTIVPIQSRFNPIMHTSRTSSSGPNIQNPRRRPGVRECFVPREGYVFVDGDFVQAELHCWGQDCLDLFGESRMAEALNGGIDAHCQLGARVVGMEYEDFLRLHEKRDKEIKLPRQAAKHANFAFMGGCGIRRFIAIVYSITQGDVVLDEMFAARLKTLWFSEWPEAAPYFAHVEECIDDQGWHWVKQPRVDRLRSRATYCAAANSRFQGLCADGAKAALWAICRAQWIGDGPMRWARTVNFIHDEFLLECPEESADEVARDLARIAAEEFNKFVPDVPTTCDPVVMRYWSKDAVSVLEGGKYVPWPKAS